MRLPGRVWFRRLHLILGLALGGVLILVAVSGSAIAFRDEIREWGESDTRVPWDKTTDMGFAAARDLARRHFPEGTLQILWFPNPTRPYYEAAYARGDERFTNHARFHPATGQLLSIEPWPVLEWLERLHVDLHLGDAGSFLVRWSTLLFMLILLSGLYLWWPGFKPHLWVVIRQGPLRIWDAHRVLGFFSSIPLLAMVISGVVFAFPLATPLVHLLTGSDPPPADALDPAKMKSTVPTGGAVTDFPDETLLADAAERSPSDAFLFYITFPVQLDETRQVRLQRGYEPMPYGEVHRLYFDRYSGRLLARQQPDASLASRYLSTINSELHYGTIGGLPTRILWMTASGLVPFFALTGVLLWRKRSRRRKNLHRVRPAPESGSDEDGPA